MKSKMYGILALAMVLVMAVGMAKISISDTATASCIEVYPGDSITKAVRLEVDQSGWYTVRATGDIDVTPSERTVYLEADEPKYVFFTIRAPADVIDDYFTVIFTLYDENGDYVDDTTMCIHVSRYGEAAAAVSDFAFGAEEYYEEDGYIIVPLYVKNTGSEDITVDFTSDFYDVRFTKTTVVVQPGREVRILAKIPSREDIPSTITFYAYGAGTRKEVKVRLTSETTEVSLEMDVPKNITLEQGTVILPVRVVNTGSAKIKVRPVLKSAPFGVSAYSEYETLYPGQEAVIDLFISVGNVLSTGEKIGKVCLIDDAEVERACQYVVLDIPPAESKEVKESVQNGEKVVTLVVEGGAKAYSNAIVDVETPTGWLVKVEPDDIVDIPANAEAEIQVYFKPTDNAEDGTATIYVKASDGTILAKKTVALNKSELTGYAVLGGVSPAWVIVGIIVLAVLFALFSKGGSSAAAEIEEIKSELTKK